MLMFSLFIQVRRSKGNSNQRNVNFQLWIKKTLIIISSVVCAVETGFTSRHLHQHVEEHKRSTIGNHVKDAHGKDPETSQTPFRHHYQCRIQTPLPMPNPDIEIREGPGLPQKCFRPLGPQFGVKIRGGWAAPPAPFPWIRHWLQAFQNLKKVSEQTRLFDFWNALTRSPRSYFISL